MINLDLPKDEKLARKSHGQAGAGSDFLCTYCDASRSTVANPPYFGSKEVNLTANLLLEAAIYCNLNPSKKSQAEVAKHSFGVKELPLTSTEPSQEPPDSLHLDINVSQHLITIAIRIYHFGSKKNPTFHYEKTELLKKDLEKSEAKYFTKLRERIVTLPELTQFPGNFAREFCADENKNFIIDPLPDCPEKNTWQRLMTLWRSMRSIHKSNENPTLENIELFKLMVVEFQELIYSFKWVPPANQVHRLSHVAFFMQSRELSSVGAMSLEGLEHGNWTTKYFESTRVWKGDSKEGNKQLFRLLRLRGSPTMKRAAMLLEGAKKKEGKCSKCHQVGHRKNNKICPLFSQITESTDEEDEDFSGDERDLVFSDEGDQETEASTEEETQSADESLIQDSCEDVSETEEAEETIVEVERRAGYNERLLQDENQPSCGVS